jgi:hypothetical protein
LAKTGAVISLEAVEMDVVIVVAVSAGSKHCLKAMTSRISQVVAKRL